ncbi:MAG TPA: hypothetical protein VH374_06155 [Polyangia bacterium]|nr:hypothetical protein [Polyangia bacterium]
MPVSIIDSALEPRGPVQPVPLPVGPPVPPDQANAGLFQFRVGAALLVGGGFEDFTNSDLRSVTGGGGSWCVRAVAGNREFVGLEAAYVGAARSINVLGPGSNANLVSNGVEGALRLNVPIMRRSSLVEPFAFVGLGWQHYSVTSGDVSRLDMTNNDDIMTMPLGGGLEFAYRRFIADARFTFRETYYNDLMRATGDKLNTWGVGGQLGMEF